MQFEHHSGMAPVAQVYSGHQFGVWAGQLGDGRGLLLGEQRLSHGQRLDWHLKGAGKTPYSRMGDGRAVLRSTIRDFLASEAMHALGIPTTRALSISTSSEPVCREVTETGAMLIRIADSHLRFGHFEHFCYHQQPEQVRRLTEFAIRYHWPELKEEQDRYFLWFRDVVKRTANLIAHWQSVGFAHGVMNTDNMSLLGLTLDYGPYGFMEDYRSGYTCNHSDYQGRYAFENQPNIELWHLNRLAQSLSSLLSADSLTQALQEYAPQLLSTWGSLMRQKLGLTTREGSDNDLLNGLFSLMSAEGADYTRTLRLLSHTEQHSAASPLHDEFIDRQAFERWFTQYRHRLSQKAVSDEQRQHQMKHCNPAIVLRNYLAQQVIEQSAQGNSSALAGLHQALSDPYDSALENTRWFHRTPGWEKQLEVSCSS